MDERDMERTPCGRHLAQTWRYVQALEFRISGLKDERDRLRNELARLEGQTHSYPTEEELSPEMRARLMPEGMSWPRFVGGEPVRLGDRFENKGRQGPGAGRVELVEFGPDADVRITDGEGFEGFYDHGERVRHPEQPATASRECRDSVAPAAELPTASQSGSIGITDRDADDSWERLEEDCDMQARDYCEAHGLDAPRGRDCGPLMRRDILRRARALSEGPGVVRPGEVV